MTAARPFPRQKLELFREQADDTGALSSPASTAGAGSRPAQRMRQATDAPALAAAAPCALSGRAQNVLKELAIELTGEQPPKGPWIPSRELLLALDAERLAMARNCGPRTMREIIGWAAAHGVTITPPFQAGRSLSQMWAGLVEKASRGALTPAEAAKALQKSIRRKSSRIPLAMQAALMKMLSGCD